MGELSLLNKGNNNMDIDVIINAIAGAILIGTLFVLMRGVLYYT